METKKLLKLALEKAGGKKADLASVAAVRPEQVSRWLGGQAEPSARAYAALLKYIGTPITEVRRLVTERVAGAK